MTGLEGTSPVWYGQVPGMNDYRGRLLAGMVEAIAEVGFTDLTIADIVRRARVSKRTFYEHFATKEACFLALYERESLALVGAIEAATADLSPGVARISTGTAVYLAAIGASPRHARTLLIEILHVGAEGLALRRQVLLRFADLFVRELDGALTPNAAMAIVGGINELILEASEEDRLDRLGEIATAIHQLVEGVISVALRSR